MKQKRRVSMIGALVLITSAVVLITGCPQANGNKDKKENTAINNSGNTGNNGGNSGGSTGGNTGSNTGNGGSSSTTQERAVYVANNVYDGSPVKYTIMFNTNGTFMQRTVQGSLDIITVQGTYTGNASKDGTITITIKKMYKKDALLDYTGADATQSITIIAGNFTIAGEKYTRQ